LTDGKEIILSIRASEQVLSVGDTARGVPAPLFNAHSQQTLKKMK
jgi:hypothetical protein